MIPIINDSKDFSKGGLGRLVSLVNHDENSVKEVANGEFIATFSYAMNGLNAEHVKEQNYVMIKPNDIDEPHIFEIVYADRDYIRGVITVTAISCTYISNNDYIKELQFTDVTGRTAFDLMNANFLLEPQQFYSCDLTDKIASNDKWEHKNATSCMEELINLYGGELKRNNSGIELLTRRGRDNVAVFRYGKDVKGFTLKNDFRNICTVIIPYFSKEESNESQQGDEYSTTTQSSTTEGNTTTTTTTTKKYRKGHVVSTITTISRKTKHGNGEYTTVSERTNVREDGTRKVTTSTTKGKNGTFVRDTTTNTIRPKEEKENKKKVVYGDIVFSPLANRYARYYIQMVDFSGDNEVTDLNSLNAKAQLFFEDNKDIDLVETTCEVDLAILPRKRIESRYLEKIGMFDEVTVYIKKYNVKVKLKVKEIEYDFYNERNRSVVLGVSNKDLSDNLESLSSNIAKNELSSFNNSIDEIIRKLIEAKDKEFDEKFRQETDKIKDAIDQAKVRAEEIAKQIESEIDSKINESIGANTDEKIEAFFNDDPKIRSLKEKIAENYNGLELLLKLVGESEGSTKYSKNRLDGDTEHLIALQDEGYSISHNGDGFEVGKQYTISWGASCIPKQQANVTFRLDNNVTLTDTSILNILGGTLKSKRQSNRITPLDLKINSSGVLERIYYDTYTVEVVGDFYITKQQEITIDEPTENINISVQFKPTVDSDENSRYIGEWQETNYIIFEGGNPI